MSDTYRVVQARIHQAISTIPDGAKPNLRHLAEVYNVPYQRLRERAKGRQSRSGRPAANRKLNDEQEQMLCSWLAGLDSIGVSTTWSKLVEDGANSILALHNPDPRAPPPKVGQQWSRRWMKAHSQYFVDTQHRPGSGFPTPPPSASAATAGPQQLLQLRREEDRPEVEQDEQEEEDDQEEHEDPGYWKEEEEEQRQEEEPKALQRQADREQPNSSGTLSLLRRRRGRPSNDPHVHTTHYYVSSLGEFEASLSSYLYPPPEIPEHSACDISFWPGASFVVSIPDDSSQPSQVLPDGKPANLEKNGTGSTHTNDADLHRDPATATNRDANCQSTVQRSMSILEAMTLNDAMDTKWNRTKQRAIARAVVDAAQRVDGYRYTFRNDWNSKESPGAWRFSFICNDSLSNKDRVANRKPHASTVGKRGAKAVYDCRGGLIVKFSAPKKSLAFTYKHLPIHKKYDAGEQPLRCEGKGESAREPAGLEMVQPGTARKERTSTNECSERRSDGDNVAEVGIDKESGPPRKKQRHHIWGPRIEVPRGSESPVDGGQSPLSPQSPLQTAQNDPIPPPDLQQPLSGLGQNQQSPQPGNYNDCRTSRIRARNSLLEGFIEERRKSSYSEPKSRLSLTLQPLPSAEATEQQMISIGSEQEDVDSPLDPQAQLRELIRVKAELRKLRTENDHLKARLADCERHNKELRQEKKLRTFNFTDAG
ncbi:hypothetical protein W97_08715 [Coniosporium apollinis CBS 100218]|uniref:HTH CENPB-type domain-containing protein n=1 Tax=Coniosporium apollinis (strain CBS 100218) TaxID=1168221 RepID=R7Z5J0_CONA1|nr:uncharacterized protein W97_08715 [Coniosporium apollinis CBS 100218]EON69455.1 hypothetical protein W97_08715 [Coniosporium apollinis CBS 100218]